MQDEKKQPGDEPKQDVPSGGAAPGGEAGDEAAAGGEAPPMNRAERRARKHKRKGEPRQLHDRGGPFARDSRGFMGRMHRRKSV